MMRTVEDLFAADQAMQDQFNQRKTRPPVYSEPRPDWDTAINALTTTYAAGDKGPTTLLDCLACIDNCWRAQPNRNKADLLALAEVGLRAGLTEPDNNPEERRWFLDRVLFWLATPLHPCNTEYDEILQLGIAADIDFTVPLRNGYTRSATN